MPPRYRITFTHAFTAGQVADALGLIGKTRNQVNDCQLTITRDQLATLSWFAENDSPYCPFYDGMYVWVEGSRYHVETVA